LVTAGLLAWRGHWAEFCVLAAAIAIMLIAVPTLKDIVDRPRPAGGLVGADGSSYPSGHATHSVIYTWIALIVTVRLRPGWRYGTALMVAGITLTAAIGLSRVYLGVHYLSDVSGGWALGVSAFVICASIAMIVTHIRQNQRA
jgi:undecaprenyl-diphosphatase